MNLLTSDLTLSVHPDGSDSNDGESDAQPLATRDKAYSAIRDHLNLGGKRVTVRLLYGEHTGIGDFAGSVLGQTRNDSITFAGIPDANGNFPIFRNFYGFMGSCGARFAVKDVDIRSFSNPGAGSHSIVAADSSKITLQGKHIWRASAVNVWHVSTSAEGAIEFDNPEINLHGDCNSLFFCVDRSRMQGTLKLFTPAGNVLAGNLITCSTQCQVWLDVQNKADVRASLRTHGIEVNNGGKLIETDPNSPYYWGHWATQV